MLRTRSFRPHLSDGCLRNRSDLVHWEDRGIHVEAVKESWEGFTSDTSPCSGFVTVDDEGVPCAGFRQVNTRTHRLHCTECTTPLTPADGGAGAQCGSITGLTGLNPKANKWDAPLEIRCAKNANLTEWGEPEYLFPVYYYRCSDLYSPRVESPATRSREFLAPLSCLPAICCRGLPYDPTRPWKDKDGKW
jgi:hypothetical protein